MYLIFFYLNLLCWLLMIGHVVILNKLMLSYTYKQLKVKLRKLEVIFLSFTVFIFTLLICFFIISASMTQNKTKAIMEKTQFIILICSKILILVLFIILYWVLLWILKKNLYFYYMRQKNRLFVLAVSNVYFLTASLVYNILQYLELTDLMVKTHGEHHVLLNICYALLLWPYYFSYYFVIYYNTKNINFMKYLKDVYIGFSIEHEYEGASIFITKSCCTKKNKHTKIRTFSKALGDITEDGIDDTDISSDSDDLDESSQTRKLNTFKSEYEQLHNI